MEITDYLETLRHEGRLFAEVARHTDPNAPVPGCPRWLVRDLVRHLGVVHRWATGFVAERREHPVALPEPPALADDALVPWLTEGHDRLLMTLAAAPPDLTCWTFLPAPSPLVFWATRQAYETAVHRVDVETALGRPISPMRPRFAAGGIEELLAGFHGRRRSPVRTDSPRTLRVRATDVADADWIVRLSDEPPRTERTAEESPVVDCTYEGPAAELYLVLWNRLPLETVRISGDVTLAHRWRDLTST
ncbi:MULTISPECIES: maleylpyruvate isomerase family mycothiol-dependent enzyme [Actinoalloteichus]|uniref:Maleylpyruvate isomerase family mycothiol-dependent enzyme n=1 Tax=Actinoalloteichus fjordicus TaxID=1612552 RepID=A0AAC9LDD1_9PSEU|nr:MULTISPECIES: maleylpyruvate isomerase family mycothiol-dependent enzyme [Actinoalloteichus]APU15778.1 hypothetical protein UA74_18750 [Actinoalloteichus fjordicus]APU21838.1 hypothetical protein UA75_19240 [Actinoalloteichus sp. GBA129-24]